MEYEHFSFKPVNGAGPRRGVFPSPPGNLQLLTVTECELSSDTLTRVVCGDGWPRVYESNPCPACAMKNKSRAGGVRGQNAGPHILVPRNSFLRSFPFFFFFCGAVLQFDWTVTCLFGLRGNIWFLPAR